MSVARRSGLRSAACASPDISSPFVARVRRKAWIQGARRRCDCLMVSSGPLRAILPWLIIVTWSATGSTSSSRCDEKSTVRPSSAMVRMMAPSMSRRTTGSRPVDGSSSTNNSGRWASAISSPKRAFCPLRVAVDPLILRCSHEARNPQALEKREVAVKAGHSIVRTVAAPDVRDAARQRDVQHVGRRASA